MLTKYHTSALGKLLVHGVRRGPATLVAVAGQRPKQLLLPSTPLCARSQTCKPASCKYLRNSSLSEPQQTILYSSLHLSSYNLQKPNSIRSLCLPQVAIALYINTMATRTLEAGLQRMSIQDENATGESSRIYTKTSKVSFFFLNPNSSKSY